MPSKLVISNLAVALSYFIAGQAGLLLAIPPSNAAAVWPAAGVALAAILISGNKILPGILLGGVLVQTASFLDPSSTEKIISSVLIGTVISTGGVCQGWLGSILVQRILERDVALLKERSIILFCLLAGPVSCVISATIGISTLFFQGILNTADLLLAWSTWWIGDSIGTLIFTPIILCFYGNPHDLWSQRIKNVALPLCILTLIAFIAFKFSYQQEMQSIEEEFERNSLQFTRELNDSIEIHIKSTNDVKRLFDNLNEVSAEIFARYTQPILLQNTQIQALEWIPKVLHNNRVNFEDSLGKSIAVPGENEEMVTSPVKEIYFPVQFLEPYAGNENAYGYDVRNNPNSRRTTKTACESGQISVTDSLKLVQDKKNQLGLVFYAPVYKKNVVGESKNTCEALAGFAASVFRLEYEINNIHKRLPKSKLLVSLKNHSRVFYSDKEIEGHSIPNQFQFKRVYEIPVANQRWKILFSPAEGFISLYSSWTIWLIIVGGLLIAALSGIGLLMLTGRALRTEELIKVRTTELQREVNVRKQAEDYLTDRTNQLLDNQKMLFDLAKTDYSYKKKPFDQIIRADAEQLKIARVSVWLFNQERSQLVCKSLYQEREHKSEELIFNIHDYPKYFRALEENGYISADNATTDLRTSEFSEHYLAPFGITSMLDVPIKIQGEMVGIVCHEHIGENRKWTVEEEDFAKSIADLCALVLVSIEHVRAENKLTFQANHDALTGLVNRRVFENRTERLLSTIKRDKCDHAMCYLDLDQFKVVNDTCGHTSGDELLRQISSLLLETVRHRDTLARLGGDEFGVLMEHCSLDDAHRVATSLLKALEDYQFTWEGRSFKIGVSIGLVAITEIVPNFTELLRQADAACYVAKDLGRNCIHVYRSEDVNLAQRHGEMQWVTRIQQALEEDCFCLYAQAIVPLDNSQEKHYEILVRMIDEQGKITPPGAFLPAAERYSQAELIDRWVIENILKILIDNPAFFKQTNLISINLSGQSITKFDFLNFITSQLMVSAIDSNKLCFEITETAAIANLSTAKKFISTLKGLGCRFALDDFGSGLSSFGYLKNLPVDYLKIDGMFVKDIVDDPIDYAMVKSINEIGQVMGMKTIAEFVENDKIKAILSEVGVDYAQGYGIAKPQSINAVIDSVLKEKA